MQYILLCSAIILEIIATTLLKASEGFTKLLPAFGCIVLYILLNDRNIRTEEELKQIFDYPIIGLIPDMTHGTGGAE